MTLSILATAVNSGNPTVSATATIPNTVLPGDLLVWHPVTRDSTTAPTVTDNDTDGNTWTRKGSETSRGTLWYKRATLGSAGKTITTANASAGSISGVLIPYRGAIENGDPFGGYSLEENISGNQSHAAITPSTANNIIGFAVYNYSNDTLNPNTYTATNPATLTEQAEATSTGGSDCSVSVATGTQTTALTTGTVSWLQTAGATVSILYSVMPETGVAVVPTLVDGYQISDDASDLTGSSVNKALETSGATTGSWSGQSLGANAFVTASYFTPSGDPGAAGVSTKTITVRLDVTTGNANFLYSVNLHRVNSSGVIQSSGASSAETSSGASGVYVLLPSVTNLGTWASGDRLRVDVRIRNTTANTAQSATISYATGSSSVFGPWTTATNKLNYGFKHPDLTLSNSDLTVTESSGGLNQLLLATVSANSGKLYYEVNATTAGSDRAVGVATIDQTVKGGGGNYLGGSQNGMAVFGSDGLSYFNGTGSAALPSWFTTGVIGCAVDLGANKIWYRLGAAGNWNNDVIANQNPATATGGLAISSPLDAATLYPAIQAAGGAVLVINLGGSSYAGTIPSGFTNWDGTTSGGTGTLSVTEAADTLSSAGTLAIQATLAKTEAADTLSATGVLALSGTLAKTEAPDTLTSSAVLALSGSLSATETPDTLSSSAVLSLQATFAQTEASDTLSSAGVISIVGSLAKTEAPDVLTSAAVLALSGTLSAIEAADTLAANGSGAGINGSLSVTEASDILSSAAVLALSATLSVTEAIDVLSSSGAVAISGTLAKTEAADTLSSNAALAIAGALTQTEVSDTLASSGSGIPGAINGTLSAVEAPDVLTSSAVLSIQATLARTEAPDTLSATGIVVVIQGSLLVIEASDFLNAIGILPINANLSIIEENDILVSIAAHILPRLPASRQRSVNFAASNRPGDGQSVRPVARQSSRPANRN